MAIGAVRVAKDEQAARVAGRVHLSANMRMLIYITSRQTAVMARQLACLQLVPLILGTKATMCDPACRAVNFSVWLTSLASPPNLACSDFLAY